MTKLEILEQQIYNEKIPILCHDFGCLPLKGLWFDGVIMVSHSVTESIEKRCILMEEYCHHRYTVGNALHDAKQEAFARGKAYEKLVPMNRLKAAKRAGCSEIYEIADYLEVTEEVLVSALDHYRSKEVI